MRYHLGFLISPPLYSFMMEILPELEQYCDVTVYRAESNNHAYQLYEKHWQDHDAFVFSGRVFLFSVTKRISEPRRPCYAFDDLTGDVREILLGLLLKDRNFDFSRVYVDIAYGKNNYLGLKDMLPPNQWPYFGDHFNRGYQLNLVEGDAYELTEMTFQHHLQLHRDGLVDLSISRFGAIVEDLKAAGVPVIYMLPSREYVVNLVLQIINSMNVSSRRNDLEGVMRIRFIGPGEERNAQMAQTGRMVLEYGGRNGYDFSMVREQDTLEFLTRYRDLEELTLRFTHSGFQEHLVPVGCPVLIGLGAGKSLYQARLNASNALDIARGSPDKVFFVDDNNVVVGPLSRSSPIFDRVPSEDIQQMASALHINHVNLQKILSYVRLKQSPVVTAEEMAGFLDITVRSANRLLGKIQQFGGANAYSENATGVRGRPRTLYELTFARQLDTNQEDRNEPATT